MALQKLSQLTSWRETSISAKPGSLRLREVNNYLKRECKSARVSWNSRQKRGKQETSVSEGFSVAYETCRAFQASQQKSCVNILSHLHSSVKEANCTRSNLGFLSVQLNLCTLDVPKVTSSHLLFNRNHIHFNNELFRAFSIHF